MPRIQKKSQYILKLLNVPNRFVDLIQEWGTKYTDALEKLVRKYKCAIDMERV